jgi:hypothetical protein
MARKFGLAKKAANARSISKTLIVSGVGATAVGGGSLGLGIGTMNPFALALGVTSIYSGYKLMQGGHGMAKLARSLESQAGVANRALGRVKSGGQSGRMAMLLGAAGRSRSSMSKTQTLGAAMARGRSGDGKPAGDGSVESYTRVQNGKSVQVQGYQRSR